MSLKQTQAASAELDTDGKGELFGLLPPILSSITAHEQMRGTNSLIGFRHLLLDKISEGGLQSLSVWTQIIHSLLTPQTIECLTWASTEQNRQGSSFFTLWSCFPQDRESTSVILRKALTLLYCLMYFRNTGGSSLKGPTQHIAGVPADPGWMKGHQSWLKATLSSGSSADIQQVESYGGCISSSHTQVGMDRWLNICNLPCPSPLFSWRLWFRNAVPPHG